MTKEKNKEKRTKKGETSNETNNNTSADTNETIVETTDVNEPTIKKENVEHEKILKMPKKWIKI